MRLKHLLINIIAEEISKYNVIFCGGFAEYLQGFKDITDVKDIDIITTEELIDILNMETHDDGIDWGYNIKRYKTTYKSQIIDAWVVDKLPDYIELNGFKVQPIEDIIKSKEIALRNNVFANTQQKEKILLNLKRLENFNTDNE